MIINNHASGKLHLLLIIIVSFLFIDSNAQKLNPDKLTFGGDIAFGISDNYWSVGVSPQVGYKLTDKFHVGAGFSYLHGQSKDFYDYNYKKNSVGLNLFAHYYPWRKIVFRLKPEIMYTWYKSEFTTYEEDRFVKNKYTSNKLVPSVIAGGGLYFKPVMILLNYELVQNKYSSYNDNVFLSVGFMF